MGLLQQVRTRVSRGARKRSTPSPRAVRALAIARGAGYRWRVENLLGKTSTSGESGSLFVTPQLFDRIVSAERSLIAIETPRAAEVLAQFRHFAVRSGNSIYAWNESDGIASLRESEVSVPGSARLPEALRYIQGSMHYGVYLFHELGAQLRFSPARAQVIGLLRQMGRGKGMAGSVRKIVLIDEQVAFSDAVDELFERIHDEPGSGRRLRLRDGRWVQ